MSIHLRIPQQSFIGLVLFQPALCFKPSSAKNQSNFHEIGQLRYFIMNLNLSIHTLNARKSIVLFRQLIHICKTNLR